MSCAIIITSPGPGHSSRPPGVTHRAAHEEMDDKPGPVGEQIGQAFAFPVALKAIGLVDPRRGRSRRAAAGASRARLRAFDRSGKARRAARRPWGETAGAGVAASDNRAADSRMGDFRVTCQMQRLRRLAKPCAAWQRTHMHSPPPQHLDTPQARRIAFHRLAGAGPGVMFLGGFMSDMTGTKASFLEQRARAAGRAFVRFDYSGHGASSGRFADGTIGQWAEDAEAVLAACTDGPQVLVGSSMGGWIALLLARRHPGRIAGLVTVAAAPDFTDAMWMGFSEADRAEMMATGAILRPSDDGDPYTITRALIEDGRAHRVFDRPLPLPFPVRMLQGTDDAAVPRVMALKLLDHAEGPDTRLTLVRGADHRFSAPDNLAHLAAALDQVLARAGAA
jgi:pimeloyl-ACP methyl ester carboxylesterase